MSLLFSPPPPPQPPIAHVRKKRRVKVHRQRLQINHQRTSASVISRGIFPLGRSKVLPPPKTNYWTSSVFFSSFFLHIIDDLQLLIRGEGVQPPLRSPNTHLDLVRLETESHTSCLPSSLYPKRHTKKKKKEPMHQSWRALERNVKSLVSPWHKILRR